MAFTTALLEQPGTGFVWLLEVSADNFATINYRYSSNTAVVNGAQYDGRISSMGNLQSGFSADHLPAPLAVDITIDNVDGLADWLCDRTPGAFVNGARFRLTLAMWDATQGYTDNPTFQTQQMGAFAMFDWPRQTESAVKLQLADDTATRLTELRIAPTLRDWINATPASGSNPTPECPLNISTVPPVPALDFDVPLPLVFGMPVVECFAAANRYNLSGLSLADAGAHHICIPVCVTADTSPINETSPFANTLIAQLSIQFRSDFQEKDLFPELLGSTLGIPRGAKGTDGWVVAADWVWQARKSRVITKSGTTWSLIWVDFDCFAYVQWFGKNYAAARGITTGSTASGVAYPTGAGTKSSGNYYIGSTPHANVGAYSAMAAINSFFVSGSPYSAITTKQQNQNAADVIQDLIAYYADTDAPDLTLIDATSFAKARATTQSLFVGGSIGQPLQVNAQKTVGPKPASVNVGVMRTTLQDICASADLDLYVRRIDGKYALACNAYSFDDITGTKPSIAETRVDAFENRRPSTGERWSPYNRIFINGPDNTTQGPYDNPAGLAALGGKPVARTISGGWNVALTTAYAADWLIGIWGVRNLETMVRPVVRFRTDKTGLALDLAILFALTWKRGTLGGPYDGTIFSVERWALNPATLDIDIEAVWQGDITATYGYLLDDEAKLFVQDSLGGAWPVRVTNASATLDFTVGGADLSTPQVVANDIVVLSDTTETASGLKRNRAMRIASVTDNQHLVVAESDLDFGAPAGTNVANWAIYHGVRTYPTSATDPVNYPSGGLMYGKACDDSDAYSDLSTANALKEG